MSLATLTLLSLVSLTTATPLTHNTTHPLTSRSTSTFNLHVWNNCHFDKEVALYQITPSFSMLQKSNPANIQPHHSLTIAAPFHETGMRLSGHAEWGAAGQWKAQALFEFEYSTYAGQEGTAYDLSVMEGSDKDIGIGVYPVSSGYQGWTNSDQTQNGSPADTVCYKGKTDFKVVFCP